MIRLASDIKTRERTYIICESDAAPKILNLQQTLIHYDCKHEGRNSDPNQ
jgi:hypothetical protein